MAVQNLSDILRKQIGKYFLLSRSFRDRLLFYMALHGLVNLFLVILYMYESPCISMAWFLFKTFKIHMILWVFVATCCAILLFVNVKLANACFHHSLLIKHFVISNIKHFVRAFTFVKTSNKFSIAMLWIRKLGSLSVLTVKKTFIVSPDEDPEACGSKAL